MDDLFLLFRTIGPRESHILRDKCTSTCWGLTPGWVPFWSHRPLDSHPISFEYSVLPNKNGVSQYNMRDVGITSDSFRLYVSCCPRQHSMQMQKMFSKKKKKNQQSVWGWFFLFSPSKSNTIVIPTLNGKKKKLDEAHCVLQIFFSPPLIIYCSPCNMTTAESLSQVSQLQPRPV